MHDEEKIALAEVRGKIFKARDALSRALDQLSEETWDRGQLGYPADQITKAKEWLEQVQRIMICRVLDLLQRAIASGDEEIGMSPGK